MINLSKNKCGGQDAHSALISDLKQVLAKYDDIPTWVQSLTDAIATPIEPINYDAFAVLRQKSEEEQMIADIERHNEIFKQKITEETKQNYKMLASQFEKIGVRVYWLTKEQVASTDREYTHGMKGSNGRIVLAVGDSRVLIDACTKSGGRIVMPYSKRDWYFKYEKRYWCISYLNAQLEPLKELTHGYSYFDTMQDLLDSANFSKMIHYLIGKL